MKCRRVIAPICCAGVLGDIADLAELDENGSELAERRRIAVDEALDLHQELGKELVDRVEVYFSDKQRRIFARRFNAADMVFQVQIGRLLQAVGDPAPSAGG